MLEEYIRLIPLGEDALDDPVAEYGFADEFARQKGNGMADEQAAEIAAKCPELVPYTTVCPHTKGELCKMCCDDIPCRGSLGAQLECTFRGENAIDYDYSNLVERATYMSFWGDKMVCVKSPCSVALLTRRVFDITPIVKPDGCPMVPQAEMLELRGRFYTVRDRSTGYDFWRDAELPIAELFLYEEQNDAEAFGERISKILPSIKKARQYLRERVEFVMEMSWEELEASANDDDTVTPDYVSVPLHNGYQFFSLTPMKDPRGPQTILLHKNSAGQVVGLSVKNGCQVKLFDGKASPQELAAMGYEYVNVGV